MLDRIRSGLKNAREKQPVKCPSSKNTHNFEYIGNDGPVCPHCNSELEKMPGRKKKCPFCSNFIYVRTRPIDEKKVLVTEEQKEKIDEQWSIVNGTHKEFIARKKEYEKTKNELKRQHGKEPSDNEVQWAILEKKQYEYAKCNHWGLYRNTIFDMAEILRKESKLEMALVRYIEVCYLDLNGPRNISNADEEFLRAFPPFDPNESWAELAPAIVDRIWRICKKLDINKDALKIMFLGHNHIVETNLKLPLSADTAWAEMEKELSNQL